MRLTTLILSLALTGCGLNTATGPTEMLGERKPPVTQRAHSRQPGGIPTNMGPGSGGAPDVPKWPWLIDRAISGMAQDD
jgi:hypothetical protein